MNRDVTPLFRSFVLRKLTSATLLITYSCNTGQAWACLYVAALALARRDIIPRINNIRQVRKKTNNRVILILAIIKLKDWGISPIHKQNLLMWCRPGRGVFVRGSPSPSEQGHHGALSRRHSGPRAAQQRPLARARTHRTCTNIVFIHTYTHTYRNSHLYLFSNKAAYCT